MKSGIEYFPLDVYLDTNMKLIEAEFGLTGFAVVVKLWQKIYAEQGYYIEWTNEVVLLFSRELCLGGNTVSEIVSAAIKRGIFDKSLFDKYSILTSQGIQKRYFKICERRKDLTVKKAYLLVDVVKFLKNVNISSENVSISVEKEYIPEQSKVKQSKVEKNIFVVDSPEFQLALKLKEFILQNDQNTKVPENLQQWASEFDRMIRIDKRTLEQISKVMEFSQKDSFWKPNILSAGKLREKFDTLWLQSNRKSTGTKANKPGNMANYDQRQYDKGYFDSLYEEV